MANLTCWRKEDLRKRANNQTNKLVIVSQYSESRDGKTANITKIYKGKNVVVSTCNPAPEKILHPLTIFIKLSTVLQNNTRYPIFMTLIISKIKKKKLRNQKAMLVRNYLF